MSSYDHYIQLIEEPSLTVINETRALRHGHREVVIDEAREAYYRNTMNWQWQEEMARRDDKRIEGMTKEGGV